MEGERILNLVWLGPFRSKSFYFTYKDCWDTTIFYVIMTDEI
jgi:hypothetical protein